MNTTGKTKMGIGGVSAALIAVVLAFACAIALHPSNAGAVDLAAGRAELAAGAPGAEAPAAVGQAAQAHVLYRTHVQSEGWQGWAKDGATSGTSGRSLRLEGLRMRLAGAGGGVRYSAHVQSLGWQGWRSDGQLAGTSRGS